VPCRAGEAEPRLPGESPDAYVQRTAREKALRALHWLGVDIDTAEHAWPRSPQPLSLRPVLAADTTVIMGDEILGKPVDAADAARMLQRLSGTRHEVHTAIVLALPEGRNVPESVFCDVSRTEVRFKALTEAEIAAYCVTGEPMGKAGAYGIQGRAAAFVEHISGSYSGVVGLPLYETARLLRRGGIPV